MNPRNADHRDLKIASGGQTWGDSFVLIVVKFWWSRNRGDWNRNRGEWSWNRF